ncbi:MAG: hypothetical protein IJN21_08645, partial [Clostridia bacterium]|nr:hypothetical protein [Clostridia bacterium]
RTAFLYAVDFRLCKKTLCDGLRYDKIHVKTMDGMKEMFESIVYMGITSKRRQSHAGQENKCE